MVSRRQFLAGALAGAVVVGGAAVGLRYKNGAPAVVSKTGSETIFGAMHFPTTLESPAFSDASIDAPFTDMLQAMGVQMVVFEWDYQVFSDSRWNSRLLSAYNYAKSKGMKTQIINQMQPAFWSAGGINPPPVYSGNGTINDYETEIATAFAQLAPDYLTVLAEPQNLQTKFKFSYSYPEWGSLLGQLLSAASGSGSSLWVDLVPNSGFDMGMVPTLAALQGLDGVGMDLYGQSNESPVEARLSEIQSGGKSWGLTETWWGSLYTDPALNTSSNAGAMGSWFSQSYPWASQRGAVMYNPFYSNLFVEGPGKVDQDYAGLTAYFSQMLSSLESGSFTSIHDAYASFISAGD